MNTSIVLKEWAPDLPSLGHEGLTVAQNVLPSTTGYRPFLPLNTALGTVTASSSAVAGVFAANGATKGSEYVYAIANLTYYEGSGGGSSFSTRGAASATSNYEKFAQFNDIVVGVGSGHTPMRHTIGSASNFTALATNGYAPEAAAVGVINRFLVLGDLVGTAGTTQYSNSIAWSSIDDCTRWPEPNSQTAIAEQSGLQIMPLELGAVMAIHGGDQHGVILQSKGVSRMTYVGPPVVFQFDQIDTTQGLVLPLASVQVGKITYFISERGFCRTDGVTVENIGDGKVDKYFFATVTFNNTIHAGYDPIDGLVYFSCPDNSLIFIYSPATNSWSYASQSHEWVVTPATGVGQAPQHIKGFNVGASSSVFGRFAGTAGSAVLATADMELNPGGRAYVSGIKPNVESTAGATAPAMTVRIGSRNDLTTAPSYTAAMSATSATGFADFRVDAKYMRAEFTITGNFRQFPGFVADYAPSSGK